MKHDDEQYSEICMNSSINQYRATQSKSYSSKAILLRNNCQKRFLQNTRQ